MPKRLPGQDFKPLFDRLSTGDEEAFTILFYHFTQQLYPFLVQKLRSDELAEELLQDIFLRCWVYRERFAGLESPEGYLFRIAANRVQDHFGERKRRQALQQANLPTQDAEAAGPHPAETMDLAEARRILIQGIGKLPAQRRKVYELKQEGLRYEEIADRLGISPHTVKNQLVEANRFLLEFLREHGLPVLLIILSWRRY
jgi:RNA polymerase sigma factor (sigma-70 family)